MNKKIAILLMAMILSSKLVIAEDAKKPSPSPSPAANISTVKDVKATCKAEGKQGKELVDCMKEKSQ